MISRKYSLLILVATVAAIGVLFFHVIRPFIFSLLFAGILTILFRPAYQWVCRVCFGWRRLAAGLTTVGVILVIMVPLSGILVFAAAESVEVGKHIVDVMELENAADAQNLINPMQNPRLARWLEWLQHWVSEDDIGQARDLFSNAMLGATTTVYERTKNLAADLISLVIGLVVMLVALYYFLAEGDRLAKEVQRLSPLEDDDVHTLFTQFEKVCRSVVLGTVVAAVMQGFFAGIGFAIVGMDRIWLLIVLATFSSFIPFLGAAAVWISVMVAMLMHQRFGAAAFLFIYGTIVISGSDNLIRAYIIGDRAQMHPLVALVTVLGAIQWVGLWGIFVGPITAAFFYALLNILRERLIVQDVEEKGEIASEA